MHGAKDTLLLRIIDSYFGQLQILYNAGIKYFILLTVPRELTPTRYSFLSFLILTLNANILYHSHRENTNFYRKRQRSYCPRDHYN